MTNGQARHTANYTPAPFELGSIPTDQHWPDVALSLPFVSNVDDLKGHTVTNVGGVNITYENPHFSLLSASFSGSNSYLDVSSPISLTGGEITVDGWVYVDPMQNGGCIVSTKQVGTIGFILGFGDSGPGTAGLKPYFGFYSGGWTVVASPDNIPTNQWVYIEGNFDGTTMRLFVAGQPKAFATTQMPTFTGGLLIGAAWYTGLFFKGRIQGLRVTPGAARNTVSYAPPKRPPPTAVPQALSGIVHDTEGNPISRIARSYRRSDGKLVGTTASDPITGVFALPADSTDEHFVVVFDDIKNALIYDHVVPVI